MAVHPPAPAPFTEYFIPAVTLSWYVAGAPAPTFVLPDLDGTGLRVQWQLELSRTSNADQASVSIFNLSKAIRDSLYEGWKAASGDFRTAMELGIALGWAGVATPLFKGQVWRFVPAETTMTEVITRIEAGDGGVTLRDATNTLGSTFATQTLGLVITYLVQTILAVEIDPASLTLITQRAAELPVASWDNYVLTGDPQDRLDELVDTLGLEWKILNGRFVVMDKGILGVTDLPTAPLLGPASGLLSWAPTDDGGVELTALADPRVIPGRQIAVIDEFGKPIDSQRHRVETVTFTGDNYAESVMRVRARKAVLV